MMTNKTRTLPTETTVLIVGAGPTGLALGTRLRQAGVDNVVIDRLEAGLSTSRAAVVHAHTLDVLDRIGAADELTRRGLAVDDFRLRDRDRTLVHIDFSALPSRHQGLLMVPQDVTEEVLRRRLEDAGGEVHRGVAMTAIAEDAAGARVSVATPEGPAVVAARFVVGADGMHSAVREAAGIAFEGGPRGQAFVLADVSMDWPLGTGEVTLFFSPEGLVVVAPLPGGRFRIVATVDVAPEVPSLADVQRLLDARGPRRARARVTEVHWGSRFRVHHRLARHYRKGRLFLMGDAAHVHSPAGGQGMNTGLVDAVVLGELIADVIRGERPEAALDLYEPLRRPAAEQVLALAGRLTTMATMKGALRRAARNALLSSLGAIPAFRRRLMMSLSGLARADLAALPRRASEGSRAEPPDVTSPRSPARGPGAGGGRRAAPRRPEWQKDGASPRG